MACAAYCSIVPAVDPKALIALSTVRSTKPSENCSGGAISADWLALISNPSTSLASRPASSSASAIASPAKSDAVRPYTFPISVMPSPAIAAVVCPLSANYTV